MGIRYYGWAVTPSELVEAGKDPWDVIHRADQRYDDPGWANTGFDKAWWLLQELFGPQRPGYELVRGNVSYPHGMMGPHESYVGLVPADRVPVVARDVDSVGDSDVRALCRGRRYGRAEDRLADEDYLSHFLAEAKTFTADAAARGHGIIYVIQ